MNITKISRLVRPKGTILGIIQNFSNLSVAQRITNLNPHVTSFNNPWIWQQNDKKDVPFVNNIKLDLPTSIKWIWPLIEQTPIVNEIEAPSVKYNTDVTKQAARLIVIRRKKMKKHKLKKLRKKMKFEWAKLRQKRELKKEKAFQAILIQQCKEAEEFSAEKYVEDRLKKLNEIIVPRYWKGRRLPEFIVREKLGLPPKK